MSPFREEGASINGERDDAYHWLTFI